MVEAIRIAENYLGKISYGPVEHEQLSLQFRRSLFIVMDIKKGDRFNKDNLRALRPGNGLAPKYLKKILGKCATRDSARGSPLSWDMVSD
jgi:sialic acid synthase SpsE